MAESHVVTRLVAKRAELAGLIDHHRKEIERIGDDLRHVDATIKVFAPDMNLRTVRAKEHRRRNSYFAPGEGPRTILGALRIAGQPLTTREVTERAMAERGIELTPERIDAMQKSIAIIIKKLLGKKLIRIVAVDKNGMRS
ncbi:hypothetical protein [Methylacidimicrobium tartarophylax]|uniref:Uncharacterized protein n=1 Tax=Methylacidimicrobium tartarophylax TaxID=1041768 RepID=A0A5E6MNP7_9BACT|nr:hypothetical protein [Methylacidimicrobium tartarophylax]VVM07623.1 hypothetical protein MAMT_01841 [Methylacidimicrobium tartarophylax]